MQERFTPRAGVGPVVNQTHFDANGELIWQSGEASEWGTANNWVCPPERKGRFRAAIDRYYARKAERNNAGAIAFAEAFMQVYEEGDKR